MVDFIEKRLLENIAYGALGGAEYRTEIIENYGGFEKRNVDWLYARSRFNVSNGVKTKADMQELIYAHRVCKGSAYGFRYKDPNDYQVTAGEGVLVPVTLQPGKYQLTKRYAIAGITDYYDYRKILKPVTGTVSVTVSGTPTSPTIDYTTGFVTLANTSSATIAANVSKTITAITNASNGVATSAAHGFTTGDWIMFNAMSSMVELEDVYAQITVLDADTFQLNINTTSFSAFTSGGTAIRYGITQTSPIRIRLAAHSLTTGTDVAIESVGGMTEINGQTFDIASTTTNYITLTDSDGRNYSARTSGGTVRVYPDASLYAWTGEFDVPVRFENDYLPAAYVYRDVQQIDQINLIELRQA